MEHVQKPVGVSADLPPSPWTHEHYGEPKSVYEHIQFEATKGTEVPIGNSRPAILARALWYAGYRGIPLWEPRVAGQPLPDSAIYSALARGRNGIASLARMTRFDEALTKLFHQIYSKHLSCFCSHTDLTNFDPPTDKEEKEARQEELARRAKVLAQQYPSFADFQYRLYNPRYVREFQRLLDAAVERQAAGQLINEEALLGLVAHVQARRADPYRNDPRWRVKLAAAGVCPQVFLDMQEDLAKRRIKKDGTRQEKENPHTSLSDLVAEGVEQGDTLTDDKAVDPFEAAAAEEAERCVRRACNAVKDPRLRAIAHALYAASGETNRKRREGQPLAKAITAWAGKHRSNLGHVTESDVQQALAAVCDELRVQS